MLNRIVVHEDSVEFYNENVLYRLNGPALIQADGIKQYWCNGFLHRLYGPAIK